MNLVLSERDVVCLKGLIGMIVELCAYQSVVKWANNVSGGDIPIEGI